MNILITGASGFIGIHLSDLLAEDYNIYKIISSSNPMSNNHCYSVDLTVKKEVKKIINVLSRKKIDVIIHLAWDGIPDFSLERCKQNLIQSINFFEFSKEPVKPYIPHI